MLDDKLVSGTVSGDVSLEGLHQDAHADAQLSIDALSVGSVAYKSAKVQLKADGHLVDASVRIDQPDGFVEAKAHASESWGAAMAPSLDPSQPLDANLSAKNFRIAALLPFVDGVLDELDGRLDADTRIELDPRAKAARLNGTLALSRGTVEASAGGGELHDIAANVKFAPDGTVTLEKLTAAGVTGKLDATGTAHVQGTHFAVGTRGGHDPQQVRHPFHGRRDGGRRLRRADRPVTASTAQGRPDVAGEGRGAEAERRTAGGLDRQPASARPDGQGPHRRPTAAIHARFVLAAARPREEGRHGTRTIGRVASRDRDAPDRRPRCPRDRAEDRPGRGRERERRRRSKGHGADHDQEGRHAGREGADVHRSRRGRSASWATIRPTHKSSSRPAGRPRTARSSMRRSRDRSRRARSRCRRSPACPAKRSSSFFSSAAPTASRRRRRRPAPRTPRIAAAGGEAAQPLNHALGQLGLGAVTAKVDTSQTANPKPEVEVQIARDISLQIAVVLGQPPPGVNPDRTLFTLDWRFLSKWSLATTVGDAGTTIFDLLWQRRY